MCSFLLCLIVLPETNVHRRKSFRNVPVIGWLIHWAHPKEVTMVDIDDGAAVVNAEPAKPPTAKTMTYLEALRDPVIRTISILYMCISATDMSFGETLPLWLIAAPDVGGLGMFSDKVGLLMLLFALPTFFSNMFFARMYKAFNNSGLLWRYCAIGVTIVVLAVPFAASIPRSVAFWYLLLFGSLKSCFFTVNFNIVHLHTAKAAPPGTIGCVYGISQSFSFSMRCVVPFIVAPAFAWSISGHHIFPFNHYFVFFVSVVPMLYSVYLTLTGPIERTAEEMAAWANEASQENRENTSDDSENKAEEPQAYTSLVNSFAMSAADSLLSQLLEVESTRRDLMREWLNRTAPRGRGKELDAAAKQLEHEDWRAVVTDSESEDERGLV